MGTTADIALDDQSGLTMGSFIRTNYDSVPANNPREQALVTPLAGW